MMNPSHLQYYTITLFHCVFAFFVMYDPVFVTIHAYIVLLAGIYLSLSDKKAERILYIIGYILGSELIWRGFGANIFWESGKLFIILFLTIIVYRLRSNGINGRLGIVFIVLLLPSFIVLEEFNRSDLSHALLGPILIGISVKDRKSVV